MDDVSSIREEGGCEVGAVGGAMEEGLRFRGSGEGSFQGEGDLVPTRYEWGGGRGVEPCFTECEGELQFYPCL